MRTSASAEESDGAGATAAAANTELFCAAAHSSGRLGIGASCAAAIDAAANAMRESARIRFAAAGEALVVLEFGIGHVVWIAGRRKPLQSILQSLLLRTGG